MLAYYHYICNTCTIDNVFINVSYRGSANTSVHGLADRFILDPHEMIGISDSRELLGATGLRRLFEPQCAHRSLILMEVQVHPKVTEIISMMSVNPSIPSHSGWQRLHFSSTKWCAHTSDIFSGRAIRPIRDQSTEIPSYNVLYEQESNVFLYFIIFIL